MTTLAAVLPAAGVLPDDDARWREWQGVYATSDRTRAIIMGALFAIAFVGVVANLVLQIA